MNKNTFFLLVVLTCTFFNSCTFSTFTHNSLVAVEELDSSLSNYLVEGLGFDSVRIKSIADSNLVIITIRYNGKFYIDDESNLLITSLLIYKNYKLLKDIKQLSFIIEFKRFENEPLTFSFNNEMIRSKYDNTLHNPIFIHFVEYTVKNIVPRETFRCNNIIKMMNEVDSSFNFNGSYWLLLFEYSSKYENDSLINRYFKDFVHSTGFPKFEMDQSKYQYFIDYTDSLRKAKK